MSDTIKPDVHVGRVAETASGRRLSDDVVIALIARAAERIGVKASELDWRIWEAACGGSLPYPATSVQPTTQLGEARG